MNEIVRTVEPARAPMMAGGRPMAIVPQSMEDCYRLATAVCKAGMAPKGLDTPEKAMVAVMHGLEIGLTPMAALQRIAVVNGRPTIWGDGAVGLVRGSGLCEWIRETIEGSGEAANAVCETKRKGEPESIMRSFSVADAKKAGLWGKQGPWQQFPTRMLAMRARAFCLRDGFADVLGGLYLKEELDNDGDQQERQQVPQQRRVAPAPTAAMIESRPEPSADAEPARQDASQASETRRRAPPPTSSPQTSAKPSTAASYDPEAVRSRLIAKLTEAFDRDALNEAWETVVGPIYDEALEPDQNAWQALFDDRAKAIKEAS